MGAKTMSRHVIFPPLPILQDVLFPFAVHEFKFRTGHQGSLRYVGHAMSLVPNHLPTSFVSLVL